MFAAVSCAILLVMAAAILARVREGPLKNAPGRLVTALAWFTTIYAAFAVVLNLAPPVVDAPTRPELAEDAEKWEYLVVPLQEVKGLQKTDDPWAPDQLNELGREGGKQSACRSSTAS